MVIESKLMLEVKAILKSFGDKYFNGDKLKRHKVIEDLNSYDEKLIQSLLNNETINRNFVISVNSKEIFKLNEFIDMFQYKEFWQDSYTNYANKIGLTVGGKFINECEDVVLDFPYKDTVLKAGMTKEDKQKEDLAPNEIFLNEIIAKDEIDVLFDKKIFKNVKKYSTEGMQPVSEFKEDDNLIIKGNNLVALHSLRDKYAGKIKLIYIDPPYNTGSDSFDYNDKYNHSSWLTFMKNRLEVTKELLAEDGSIVIYIDDNEIGYLQVLMDEIWGRENRGGIISVKRGSVTGHKTINPGVVNITEYMLIYAKNKTCWNPNKIYRGRNRNERYNNFIKNRNMDTDKWEFCSLLDAFAEHKNIEKNKLKKQLGNNFEKEIMEFIKLNAKSVIQFAYPDSDKVSKEAKEIINLSKKDKEKIYILKRENEKDIVLKGGQRLLFYSDRLVKVDGELVTGELVSNFWDDVLPNDLHSEGNVKFKKGKKSEKAIKRIIELTTNENDIVLDFFLGSGTTTAVAHKMKRRFIGIEQMDYINTISVPRLQKVIEGEQSGISKNVEWQGDGSFVYAELFEKSAGFIKDILKTKTIDDLKKVYNIMIEVGDLDFKADLSKIDWTMSFEDNQKLLIKIIDKNQLYFNYSEIDDSEVREYLTDEEVTFNKNFYENLEV
ncbi:site-specific DNA-methyltransferase [Clostridium sporogenes]|uniref:Type III restriction endonuclease subunit M n=1 Tax=Clostridium sporogenes TaxID=1509 RepID=A0ABX4K3Z4_CLOSG|nr:site-specific DNA-methyltransferase [Clostridium sporogenes]MBW5458722.1 site-specific DNA-methyltransferase [Clostridium sporogenes]NFF62587.1 site-specific DNA-methyltransferase [Clostridium sporogenes]PHG99993.1 type III restriction endonuclease subunit M [Clostridium sporogenes]UBI11030.1 site-specific DNA-methyltransferase [Clostridium sporogenes]